MKLKLSKVDLHKAPGTGSFIRFDLHVFSAGASEEDKPAFAIRGCRWFKGHLRGPSVKVRTSWYDQVLFGGGPDGDVVERGVRTLLQRLPVWEEMEKDSIVPAEDETSVEVL